MQPDDGEQKSDDDVTTIPVVEEFLEISYGTDYLGNEDGYHRDEKVILTIIDKHGETISGIWEKEWAEIALGIQTCRKEGSTRSGRFIEHSEGKTLRIYRSACPVTVQFRHISEYISYDSEGSSSSYDEWLRYEASDSRGKQKG